MDPCSRIERWLTPYADGELDAAHILEVDDHLERCELCAERVAFMKAMHKSLRRAAVRAPVSLHERMRAVLRERAEAEADAAGATERKASAAAVAQADAEEATERKSSAAVDNVRELPLRAARTHSSKRAAAARDTALASQLAKLRYMWPLAAAAVFVLVLVSVRPGEEVARSSGHAVETTQRRTEVAARGSDGIELGADGVGVVADGAGLGAGGVGVVADGVERRAAVPAPVAVAERRVSMAPSERVSQSDPLDPELASGVAPDGVSSELDPSDPMRVASAADPAETAFSVLGVPPGQNVASESLATLDNIIEDLVAQHAQPLPPETTDPKGLERFDRFVGVRVAKPRYEPFGARYVGARLHPVYGNRTALLQYVVGKGHRVTLYVFDSQRVPMRARVLKPRPAEARPAYVGHLRGYTVAASENNGVGYALASDLNTDESAKLVLAAAHP